MDPTYFVPVSPAVKLLIPLDFVLLPVQALNPELLRPFYPQSLMVLSSILQVIVRKNVGVTFIYHNQNHNTLHKTRSCSEIYTYIFSAWTLERASFQLFRPKSKIQYFASVQVHRLNTLRYQIMMVSEITLAPPSLD